MGLKENVGFKEKLGFEEKLEKPVRRAKKGKSERVGEPGREDPR